MARIRSIKPEFWSDAKISKLSHGCMAFFIGLWNFCDDEGKCENDAKQLSLRMPVFRSKDILTWISQLSRSGLVQVSQCSQWVLVTNWNHQRINRPIPPKVKTDSIQWVPIDESLFTHHDSKFTQRKDRIGREKKGSDQDHCEHVVSVTKKEQKTSVVSLLQLRKELHLETHGVEPIGGAQVNGILSSLVKSVGLDDSLQILRYFYAVPNNFYRTNAHELKIMIRDKAKLLTEVRRQAPILPDSRSQAFDDAKHFASVREEILRRAKIMEEKNQ